MGFFGSLWKGVKGLLGGITGDAALGAGASIAGNLMGANSQKSANETNLRINQMNNEFNERMMNQQMNYNTAMYNRQYYDDIAKMNMQNDYNFKMMDKANDFNMRMFNAQNAYNSASAQRQRLEAAGLNPYLMMNGGNAGIASSHGSSSASSSAGGAPSAGGVSAASAGAAGNARGYDYNFQGIPDAILQGKQGKIMDEQYKQWVMDNQTRAQKNLEEINYLISKTNNEKIQHKLSTVQYRYADELEQLSLQNMKQTNQNLAQQEKLIVREALLKQKELDIFDERTQLEFAERAADILFTRVGTRTEQLRAKHELEKLYETTARANGIKLDNRIKESSVDALIAKAYRDAAPSSLVQAGWMTGEAAYNAYKSRWQKIVDTDWKNIHKKGYSKPWD